MKFFSTLLFSACFALALTAPFARATDITITAASVVPSSSAKYGDERAAGEALTGGQLVYFHSDGKYYKADADASTDTGRIRTVAGLVPLSAVAAGQRFRPVVEDPALTIGATISMSAPVYVLSGTAGGIAPSADITTGWYTTVVGVSKTTTVINFKASGIASTTAAVAP